MLDLDWPLSVISVCGLVVVGALLMTDGLAPSAAASAEPEVGRLSFASGRVRRKSSGTLVWEELAAGQALRSRDTLFVAPGGAAGLSLGEGTHLDMDENSLVVLDPPREQRRGVTVALVKGSLSGLAAADGLSIDGAGGTTRLAAGAEARVTLGENASQRVEVFAGSANLTTSKGSATLGAHEAAVASAGGVTSGGVLPVRLESPERDALIAFSGELPSVALRWTASSEGPWSVQLARDRRFSVELTTRAVEAPGALGFAPSGEGTWYWRVVDARGEIRSEARRLQLVREVPTTLLVPAEGEVVHAPAGKTFQLAWAPVSGAAHYRVELSVDETFATPTLFLEVEKPWLWAPGTLAEATYHWRVRVAEPGRGASPWSRTGTFRLIVKPLPDVPELIDSEIEVDGDSAHR